MLSRTGHPSLRLSEHKSALGVQQAAGAAHCSSNARPALTRRHFDICNTHNAQQEERGRHRRGAPTCTACVKPTLRPHLSSVHRPSRHQVLRGPRSAPRTLRLTYSVTLLSSPNTVSGRALSRPWVSLSPGNPPGFPPSSVQFLVSVPRMRRCDTMGIYAHTLSVCKHTHMHTHTHTHTHTHIHTHTHTHTHIRPRLHSQTGIRVHTVLTRTSAACRYIYHPSPPLSHANTAPYMLSCAHTLPWRSLSYVCI